MIRKEPCSFTKMYLDGNSKNGKEDKWNIGWILLHATKKQEGINGGLSKRSREGMPNTNTIEAVDVWQVQYSYTMQ
jgi:hypothetical protein